MGSPSLYSARKTTLALAVALSFAWQAPVFAHGGEAHMVPMDETCRCAVGRLRPDLYPD